MKSTLPDIWMVDTTLRDGAQTPGVIFYPLEKLEIASGLAACGIDEIEAGIPAMGDAACQEIIALAHLDLPCVLSCWCRAVKGDISLAAGCNAQGCHISFPTSSILLKTFDKDEAWVLNTLEDLVQYGRRHFDQVSVGAQDATRTDTRFLHQFAKLSRDLGVHRIRLADTVGLASPAMVTDMVAGLCGTVPGLDLEFHGHNDLGMATANAVSAVDAGATALSVTVNGLGERAGNAPLEETAVALFGMGAAKGRLRLSGLADLCNRVAGFSNQKIPPAKPIVGSRIFYHESGIHITGLMKNPSSYQLYDPGLVGGPPPIFTLGSHSGAAGICHMLNERGIYITKKAAQKLVPVVMEKIMAQRGSLTPDFLEKIYRSAFLKHR